MATTKDPMKLRARRLAEADEQHRDLVLAATTQHALVRELDRRLVNGDAAELQYYAGVLVSVAGELDARQELTSQRPYRHYQRVFAGDGDHTAHALELRQQLISDLLRWPAVRAKYSERLPR